MEDKKEKVIDKMLEELNSLEDEKVDEKKKENNKKVLLKTNFNTILSSQEKTLYKNIGVEFAKGGLKRINDFLKAKQKEEELASFGKKVPTGEDIKKELEKSKKKKSSWFTKLMMGIGVLSFIFLFFKDKIMGFIKDLTSDENGLLNKIFNIFDTSNENSLMSSIKKLFELAAKKMNQIRAFFNINAQDASQTFIDFLSGSLKAIMDTAAEFLKYSVEFLKGGGNEGSTPKTETTVNLSPFAPHIQRVINNYNENVNKGSFDSQIVSQNLIELSNGVGKIDFVNNPNLRPFLTSLITKEGLGNFIVDGQVTDDFKNNLDKLIEGATGPLRTYLVSIRESIDNIEDGKTITPEDLENLLNAQFSERFGIDTNRFIEEIVSRIVNGDINEEELDATITLHEILTTENETDKIVKLYNFKKSIFDLMYSKLDDSIVDLKNHDDEILKGIQRSIKTVKKEIFDAYTNELNKSLENLKPDGFIITRNDYMMSIKVLGDFYRNEIEEMKEQKSIMEEINKEIKNKEKNENKSNGVAVVPIIEEKKETNYNNGSRVLIAMRNLASAYSMA